MFNRDAAARAAWRRRIRAFADAYEGKLMTYELGLEMEQHLRDSLQELVAAGELDGPVTVTWVWGSMDRFRRFVWRICNRVFPSIAKRKRDKLNRVIRPHHGNQRYFPPFWAWEFPETTFIIKSPQLGSQALKFGLEKTDDGE